MKKWNELPVEIQEKMLERQEEQTGKRDTSVFEKNIQAYDSIGGFTWNDTIEGVIFWGDVIFCEKLDVFYGKYPKYPDLKNEIIIKDVQKDTLPTLYLRWYDDGKKVELQQLFIVNGESEWRTIETVKE